MALLISKLKLHPPQRTKKTYVFLDILQESPYRKCRLWTKVFFIILVYIFMYFYTFISNNVLLISDQSVLQVISVTASGVSYNIVTSNFYNFNNIYSGTTQTISDINNMYCTIDSYNGGPKYSSTANGSSTFYTNFLVAGIISFGTLCYI
jgi:hypothetical protein